MDGAANPATTAKSDEGLRLSDLINLGSKYHSEGKFDAARLHLLAALSIDPLCAPALSNLAGTLIMMGFSEAAAAVARRGLVMMPDNPGLMMNLGSAYVHSRRYPEGLELTKAALRRMPDSAALYHNLGLAYYNMNRHVEALEAYDNAVKLEQTPRAELLSDRALAILATGKLKEGLDAYEIRFDPRGATSISKRGRGFAEWRGEGVAGKCILALHEQGFGDGLMLCRFLSLMTAAGADITLAVPSALIRLMQSSFPQIEVRDWDDATLSEERFDFETPLMSMMGHLGIAHPSDIAFGGPYLRTDLDPPIKLPVGGVRIGLCWASGDHSPHLRRRRRVVPLSLLVPLLEIPHVRLFSLQKKIEPRGKHLEPDAQRELTELGLESLIFDSMHLCEDFAQTAAIVKELDLVISVDSAVAHLAGGLGKPVMMLAPYTRCWRWWDTHRGGTGAPWYRDFTIFPQSADGSWDEATKRTIRAVRRRLTP